MDGARRRVHSAWGYHRPPHPMHRRARGSRKEQGMWRIPQDRRGADRAVSAAVRMATAHPPFPGPFNDIY
jgi:hypothetical protein